MDFQKFIKQKYLSYFLLFICIIYCAIEAQNNGDFYIFLLASDLLKTNGNIYTATFVDGFHFFNSPLFATLLLPFTYLPAYIPKLLWLLCNVFFVYKIIMIIKKLLNIDLLDEKTKLVFWIISTVLSIRFVLFNFHLIQMNIFLLYAILQSVMWFNEKKYLQGGILLALAINIKLLPLVLIPYLIYRAEWKGLLFTIAASIL